MKYRSKKARKRAAPTINPFVSEAQRRACYAGAMPGVDCAEWESKTEGKLPKRKPTHNAVEDQARDDHGRWVAMSEWAHSLTKELADPILGTFHTEPLEHAARALAHMKQEEYIEAMKAHFEAAAVHDRNGKKLANPTSRKVHRKARDLHLEIAREIHHQTGGGTKNRKTTRNAVLKIDPSRTVTLRRQHIAALRRRFNTLRAAILKLVWREDAFGLEAARNQFCATGVGGGVDPTCAPSSAVGKVIGAVKDAEHWAADKFAKGFGKLPVTVQDALQGTRAVAFAGWTASQSLAERISKEKGSTPEQAAKLRATLAAADIVAFKPASIASASLGPAVAAASWVVPPVTGLYLAYSAARHPIATFRAAKSLVRDIASGARAAVSTALDIYNSSPKAAGEALAAHGYDDWYAALLHAAEMDVPTAERAFRVQPLDMSSPSPDDEQWLRSQSPTTNAGRFAFHTSPEKVEAFQRWLQAQYKALLTSKAEEEAWRKYAEAGYRKGAGRAFDDSRAAARTASAGNQDRMSFYAGTREEFLKSSFGAPVAVEKVKLLAGRSFDDLENITTDMSARMSRTLTDGLVEGKGARAVARDMMEDVDIGEERALTIARTEIIRAHAEGQLDAFDNLGVEEIGIEAEWSTAGDDRVCPECGDMEGTILSVDDARGMIPQHPNCRCAFIPVLPDELTGNQLIDEFNRRLGARA